MGHWYTVALPSFSDEAKVTEMNLDLVVDFENQILTGSVVLTVEKVNPDVNSLVCCLLVRLSTVGISTLPLH